MERGFSLKSQDFKDITVPKLTHQFNVILIKTPSAYFINLDKRILISTSKCKVPRIVKNMLKITEGLLSRLIIKPQCNNGTELEQTWKDQMRPIGTQT